mmetsp:Transcript_33907/g.63274  ORF Transcript_33907/g.63274 Transcript_33907/m.63274 type:complete len:271 (-) Transcript_33907:1849-2661(-)
MLSLLALSCADAPHAFNTTLQSTDRHHAPHLLSPFTTPSLLMERSRRRDVPLQLGLLLVLFLTNRGVPPLEVQHNQPLHYSLSWPRHAQLPDGIAIAPNTSGQRLPLLCCRHCPRPLLAWRCPVAGCSSVLANLVIAIITINDHSFDIIIIIIIRTESETTTLKAAITTSNIRITPLVAPDATNIIITPTVVHVRTLSAPAFAFRGRARCITDNRSLTSCTTDVNRHLILDSLCCGMRSRKCAQRHLSSSVSGCVFQRLHDSSHPRFEFL